MADNEPEERSSENLGEKTRRAKTTSESDGVWFHEASDTELDALRAMIGKRVEDGDERDQVNDDIGEKENFK